jgi:hypothetical protein
MMFRKGIVDCGQDFVDHRLIELKTSVCWRTDRQLYRRDFTGTGSKPPRDQNLAHFINYLQRRGIRLSFVS